MLRHAILSCSCLQYNISHVTSFFQILFATEAWNFHIYSVVGGVHLPPIVFNYDCVHHLLIMKKWTWTENFIVKLIVSSYGLICVLFFVPYCGILPFWCRVGDVGRHLIQRHVTLRDILVSSDTEWHHAPDLTVSGVRMRNGFFRNGKVDSNHE